MRKGWGTGPFPSCSPNVHSSAFSPSLPWPGCKCVLSLGIWHLWVQGKQHCIVMQIILFPAGTPCAWWSPLSQEKLSSCLLLLWCLYRDTRADRVLHPCSTQHPLSTVFFFPFLLHFSTMHTQPKPVPSPLLSFWRQQPWEDVQLSSTIHGSKGKHTAIFLCFLHLGTPPHHPSFSP